MWVRSVADLLSERSPCQADNVLVQDIGDRCLKHSIVGRQNFKPRPQGIGTEGLIHPCPLQFIPDQTRAVWATGRGPLVQAGLSRSGPGGTLPEQAPRSTGAALFNPFAWLSTRRV